jgi:hypothetical protein
LSRAAPQRVGPGAGAVARGAVPAARSRAGVTTFNNVNPGFGAARPRVNNAYGTNIYGLGPGYGGFGYGYGAGYRGYGYRRYGNGLLSMFRWVYIPGIGWVLMPITAFGGGVAGVGAVPGVGIVPPVF